MGGTPALLGASIGAKALGTGMQIRNANRAQRAADREYAREYARQEAFKQQGDQEFANALQNFERGAVEAREQQAMERRRALADDLIQGAQIGSPVSGRQPKVVEQAFAREIGNALSEGRDFSRRFAALGAPTDARLAESILAGRSNQAFDQLARSAGGSARIAPIEAQAAYNDKFNPLWGDLVNSVGQLGTLYSFSRPAPTSPQIPRRGPGAGPPIRL